MNKDIEINDTNKTKKKKNILIIICIVIIFVIGMVILNRDVIFKNNNNINGNMQENKKSKDNNEINENNEPKEETKSKEISNTNTVVDGKVLDLYNIINKGHLSFCDEKDYFYQNRYIDYYKLGSVAKNAIIAYTLEPTKKEYSSIEEVKNIKDSEWINVIIKNSQDYDLTFMIFDYTQFNTNYKKLFGEKNNANFKAFEYDGMACGINSTTNTFECKAQEGGWIGDEHLYTKIVSAKENNNEYIIYDEMAYCNFGKNYDENQSYDCYNQFNQGGYGSEDYPIDSNIIKSNVTITDNTLYPEGFENWAQKYKHVFKKNSDGTYYWYSTEPVNKIE